MKNYKYDYRSCAEISLKVLEKEREKLCADSSNAHNSMIYSGLHEFESDEKRDLYFQAYIVGWLDAHWNEMVKILDSHNEYKIYERKAITLFFAKYLEILVENCSKTEILADLIVSDILKMKRKILLEMIEISEKWQEYNEQLKAENKKNREKFKRRINQIKNEQEKIK